MNVTVIPVGFLGTNCYLLESASKECAIIDPGAQPAKLAEVIAKANLNPKYILLTHGHHDHIGGVNKLREEFPQIGLYIGKGDMEQLEDTQKSYATARGMTDKEFPVPGAKGVGDGDILELGELQIKVLDTPGHTKGGVCYIVEDMIFSGDTLFLNDIGRCDLYGGDYKVMKQSLTKLVALPGNYTVYPGHGDATTLEHERKNNPYINQ